MALTRISAKWAFPWSIVFKLLNHEDRWIWKIECIISFRFRPRYLKVNRPNIWQVSFFWDQDSNFLNGCSWNALTVKRLTKYWNVNKVSSIVLGNGDDWCCKIKVKDYRRNYPVYNLNGKEKYQYSCKLQLI